MGNTSGNIRIAFLKILLPVFVGITLMSCADDVDDDFIGWEESSYKPIIMNRNELENSIEFKESRSLVQTGKIYSYGIYILINERYEGVHIFNNADPRNPQKIGFINVPGCVDMAVKNGILYVDNAVDMVAIDINSLPDIQITERIKAIFPELTPPDLTFVPYEYSLEQRPANTIIVNWERK